MSQRQPLSMYQVPPALPLTNPPIIFPIILSSLVLRFFSLSGQHCLIVFPVCAITQ